MAFSPFTRLRHFVRNSIWHLPLSSVRGQDQARLFALRQAHHFLRYIQHPEFRQKRNAFFKYAITGYVTYASAQSIGRRSERLKEIEKIKNEIDKHENTIRDLVKSLGFMNFEYISDTKVVTVKLSDMVNMSRQLYELQAKIDSLKTQMVSLIVYSPTKPFMYDPRYHEYHDPSNGAPHADRHQPTKYRKEPDAFAMLYEAYNFSSEEKTIEPELPKLETSSIINIPYPHKTPFLYPSTFKDTVPFVPRWITDTLGTDAVTQMRIADSRLNKLNEMIYSLARVFNFVFLYKGIIENNQREHTSLYQEYQARLDSDDIYAAYLNKTLNRNILSVNANAGPQRDDIVVQLGQYIDALERDHHISQEWINRMRNLQGFALESLAHSNSRTDIKAKIKYYEKAENVFLAILGIKMPVAGELLLQGLIHDRYKIPVTANLIETLVNKSITFKEKARELQDNIEEIEKDIFEKKIVDHPALPHLKQQYEENLCHSKKSLLLAEKYADVLKKASLEPFILKVLAKVNTQLGLLHSDQMVTMNESESAKQAFWHFKTAEDQLTRILIDPKLKEKENDKENGFAAYIRAKSHRALIYYYIHYRFTPSFLLSEKEALSYLLKSKKECEECIEESSKLPPHIPNIASLQYLGANIIPALHPRDPEKIKEGLLLLIKGYEVSPTVADKQLFEGKIASVSKTIALLPEGRTILKDLAGKYPIYSLSIYL